MTASRNIKLIIEYDGTDYSGFQLQPGKRTVQGELEKALRTITKEHVRITGAGRTDTGVHAIGQVISFRTKCTIPTDRMAPALNSVLPRDIIARDASEEPNEFDARHSALSRAYRYVILNDAMPSVLNVRYVWCVSDGLDIRAMKRAAKHLIGVHDFTSFSAMGKKTESRVRELLEIAVRREDNCIIIDVKANAYLRSMVRIIIGTLVEVGQGRRKARDIKDILELRDRRMAGKTAPPQGLVLVEVTY